MYVNILLHTHTHLQIQTCYFIHIIAENVKHFSLVTDTPLVTHRRVQLQHRAAIATLYKYDFCNIK